MPFPIFPFQGSLQQHERDELHGKFADEQFRYSHQNSVFMFSNSFSCFDEILNLGFVTKNAHILLLTSRFERAVNFGAKFLILVKVYV